jgi:cell division protein FtsZ
VGALVIAFVTMPFTFEGGRRLKQAEDGLAELRRTCDAVIPLPNDILLQESADRTSVLDAFSMADDWIGRGVRSIWAMLNRTGLINLDYATLRQAFSQKCGKTLFGLGTGEGANAVTDALTSLKTCPLLHTPEFSRKADRILVNIVGGPDLGLAQVNEMMADVADQFGRDAHIYLGAVIDEGMSGRIELCVIGTSDIGRAPVRRATAPVPGLAIQNTPG